MPIEGSPVAEAEFAEATARLCAALEGSAGPLVLVSNEIGMGVSPVTRAARQFVDELGQLHQAVAAKCASVTLMVAGIEVAVKRPPLSEVR